MSDSLPLRKRYAVFLRDRGACVYCGATLQAGATLTVDHVVSRKRGGGDELANLVTACRACNEDKAHFGLRAYLVDLQERGRPTAGIAERVAAALAAPVDWEAVEQAVLAARARKRDDR